MGTPGSRVRRVAEVPGWFAVVAFWLLLALVLAFAGRGHPPIVTATGEVTRVSVLDDGTWRVSFQGNVDGSQHWRIVSSVRPGTDTVYLTAEQYHDSCPGSCFIAGLDCITGRWTLDIPAPAQPPAGVVPALRLLRVAPSPPTLRVVDAPTGAEVPVDHRPGPAMHPENCGD